VGRGRSSRRPGAEPQKQTRKQLRAQASRSGEATPLHYRSPGQAICRLAGASFGVGVGGGGGGVGGEFPERGSGDRRG